MAVNCSDMGISMYRKVSYINNGSVSLQAAFADAYIDGIVSEIRV